MSRDKALLNEYGELIDAKDSTSRPIDYSAKIEREKCEICGRSVDIIYHACKGCNDDRAYCSDACFNRHLRREHYEEEFCAECGSKLGKRYTFSSKMNSTLGEEPRFCDGYCLDRYREKNICTECGDELPNTYTYGDDVDRAMGKRTRFCSSYCLREYRSRKLCAECGRRVPSTYSYCPRCGDSQYRFCGRSYCYDQHWKRHH